MLLSVSYNEIQISQIGNQTRPRNLFIPEPLLMLLLSISWELGLCLLGWHPAEKPKHHLFWYHRVTVFE